MRERSAAILLLLLAALHVGDAVARLRGPPALGPPADRVPGAPGADVPVERPGRGVACARPAVAATCPPLGARRRWLLGLPIDARTARAEDLMALPGIGPRLAARIVATRPADGQALARIRGVGPRRGAAFAARLGLDGPRIRDICSMGSWPTTSNGCDKLR